MHHFIESNIAQLKAKEVVRKAQEKRDKENRERWLGVAPRKLSSLLGHDIKAHNDGLRYKMDVINTPAPVYAESQEELHYKLLANIMEDRLDKVKIELENEKKNCNTAISHRDAYHKYSTINFEVARLLEGRFASKCPVCAGKFIEVNGEVYAISRFDREYETPRLVAKGVRFKENVRCPQCDHIALVHPAPIEAPEESKIKEGHDTIEPAPTSGYFGFVKDMALFVALFASLYLLIHTFK